MTRIPYFRLLAISLLAAAFMSAGAALADRPLTPEQARALALERVPGDVIDTARSLRNGAIVFQYEILQEDGTVMEIEIDSATREILQLDVNRRGEDGTLPEAAIPAEEASAIAIRHIEKTTSGLRGVEVLSEEYKTAGGQFVYEFLLRRGIDRYRVQVNANSGVVVSSLEAE